MLIINIAITFKNQEEACTESQTSLPVTHVD